MFSTVTSEEYYKGLHVPHQVFINPSSAVSGEYGWVPSKVGSHSSNPASPSLKSAHPGKRALSDSLSDHFPPDSSVWSDSSHYVTS